MAKVIVRGWILYSWKNNHVRSLWRSVSAGTVVDSSEFLALSRHISVSALPASRSVSGKISKLTISERKIHNLHNFFARRFFDTSRWSKATSCLAKKRNVELTFSLKWKQQNFDCDVDEGWKWTFCGIDKSRIIGKKLFSFSSTMRVVFSHLFVTEYVWYVQYTICIIFI